MIYCAAGGNRQPSAADWASGLLAFGAGCNLALWNPQSETQAGISDLFSGHSGNVNAVKIYDEDVSRYILTGGADSTIRIWKVEGPRAIVSQVQCLKDHHGSINALAVLPKRRVFVSASADGTIKVWTFENGQARLVQSLGLKARYIPLTCSIFELTDSSIVLAVGGTSELVHLYLQDHGSTEFAIQASLSGHESWIRSLDFVSEDLDLQSDVLLASASQDKFVRIWRISREVQPLSTASNDRSAPVHLLSNKAHRLRGADSTHRVTFEALLVGHEDWIYTVRWAPRNSTPGTPTLLSASADNSLSLWRPDEASNVWVCQTRLGEISAQKGSTTATGSTGGFWIGLWQPDGLGVASLGRTGSWRRWTYDNDHDSWMQQIGAGGHTKEVQSCSWSPDGAYLLSTGSDQTTRMHAEWQHGGSSTWHEFARPQIHGYDLNCVASLNPDQFVSGAEEKLLRVFNKPKMVDQMLHMLSGLSRASHGELPDAADIPVLGLSNRAINDHDAANPELQDESSISTRDQALSKRAVPFEHPPVEDQLARHTLWPEHEKLYGHGYEVSAVASTADGSLIATACKASSIDHAVVRLYETSGWREVKPPLASHSLTVTSLSFSTDARYLLSVGRDRAWFVYERETSDPKAYKIASSNLKGHTRMILDCAWAPSDVGYMFATAGRDKTVRLWTLKNDKVDMLLSTMGDSAVTAVAFAETTDRNDNLQLAYGTETGIIHLLGISKAGNVVSSETLESAKAPSSTINALIWRPAVSDPQAGKYLAAVSDDNSVRIFVIGTA